MTYACLCYQIKTHKADDSALFGDSTGSQADVAKRRQCIEAVLTVVEDWMVALERDHRGKSTYFLMIYKAVLHPDQVTVNMDATNLIDFFVPTEKDPIIVNFSRLSSAYEDLLTRFGGKSSIDRESLSSSISPLYDDCRSFQSDMKALISIVE